MRSARAPESSLESLRAIWQTPGGGPVSSVRLGAVEIRLSATLSRRANPSTRRRRRRSPPAHHIDPSRQSVRPSVRSYTPQSTGKAAVGRTDKFAICENDVGVADAAAAQSRRARFRAQFNQRCAGGLYCRLARSLVYVYFSLSVAVYSRPTKLTASVHVRSEFMFLLLK